MGKVGKAASFLKLYRYEKAEILDVICSKLGGVRTGKANGSEVFVNVWNVVHTGLSQERQLPIIQIDF